MRILWIAVVCLAMGTLAFGQEKEKPKTISVTGKLVNIVAIGGETQGWAVDLNSPLDVGGQKLNRIEIDPKGVKIQSFRDKPVEVTGTLEKLSGVTRKEYWVIVAQKVTEAKTK
jgi:hypothetical protein